MTVSTRKDRRHSPRIKCRFSCDLIGLSEPISGTVLDIADGGLCVYTLSEVNESDPLTVQMNVPTLGRLDIEAIAWHVRRARRRNTRERCFLVGLMLSKAPDAYFELVSRNRPDPPRKSDRALNPPSDPLPDLGTDTQGLRLFRVRIRAPSGSRSRVLSLSAKSETEARALAISQVDEGWDVLEVFAV